MRLTRAGCARLWTSAQTDPPKSWEGRAKCTLCPIGARHAGGQVVATAEAVQAMRPICPRCDRASDRLTRDRFCVSCYNRHLECVRGSNAKGNRPALADTLHSAMFAVADQLRGRTAVLDLVRDTREAIVILSKSATGPMSFGAPRVLVPGYAQVEMTLWTARDLVRDEVALASAVVRRRATRIPVAPASQVEFALGGGVTRFGPFLPLSGLPT